MVRRLFRPSLLEFGRCKPIPTRARGKLLQDAGSVAVNVRGAYIEICVRNQMRAAASGERTDGQYLAMGALGTALRGKLKVPIFTCRIGADDALRGSGFGFLVVGLFADVCEPEGPRAVRLPPCGSH